MCPTNIGTPHGSWVGGVGVAPMFRRPCSNVPDGRSSHKHWGLHAAEPITRLRSDDTAEPAWIPPPLNAHHELGGARPPLVGQPGLWQGPWPCSQRLYSLLLPRASAHQPDLRPASIA